MFRAVGMPSRKTSISPEESPQARYTLSLASIGSKRIFRFLPVPEPVVSQAKPSLGTGVVWCRADAVATGSETQPGRTFCSSAAQAVGETEVPSGKTVITSRP